MPFRSLARLLLVLGLAVAAPATLHAQDDVYSQSELDTPARLASQEVTARLLARSYPPALKRAGVTGAVELQFVVDASGKVETSSVKVLESTNDELAEAAKAVVADIRFRPGVVKGQPVRSVVTLPIAYQ